MNSIEESLEELTQVVLALSDSLAVQVRKLALLYKVLALAMVLALGGLGVALLQLMTVRANAARLDALQAVTSGEVLCPLYGVFLQSYNPESAAALEDPDRYEASFKVILRGSQALHCPAVP